MQMRSISPPGQTHETDLLALLDHLPQFDKHLAAVCVSRKIIPLMLDDDEVAISRHTLGINHATVLGSENGSSYLCRDIKPVMVSSAAIAEPA